MLVKLLIYATLALVPMIPALVLFKSLSPKKKSESDASSQADSSASLEGEIPGIPGKFRLGGPVAGYALLVFFSFHEVVPYLFSQPVRVVHVRGSMKFEPGSRPSAADIKAEMHPPDLDVRDGRTFDWPVKIAEGDNAFIVLQPNGYEGQTLFLSGDAPFGSPSYKHHFDKDGNIIYDEPIVFQKLATSVVEAGPSTTGGKS